MNPRLVVTAPTGKLFPALPDRPHPHTKAAILTGVIKGGKSLLPSGICGVDGGFERGDAVRLCDRDGHEFARGVISYSLAETLQIMGKQCADIEKILGYKYRDEVVGRDDLVLTLEDEEEVD